MPGPFGDAQIITFLISWIHDPLGFGNCLGNSQNVEKCYTYSFTIKYKGHQPFIQANSLESFGPYALFGKTEEDGSFSFTEAGQNVLENLPSNALCAKAGTRLLLVFDSREDGAQDDARALAILASQHGFAVSRTLIADGGCGTVRALVTGRNGRFETVSLTMPDGTRKTELIGILPGSIAALEAHGRDAAGIGLLIGKALDLGYRSASGTSMRRTRRCIRMRSSGTASPKPTVRRSMRVSANAS